MIQEEANVVFDEGRKTLDLVSSQGIKQALPVNLYEKFADISDSFSL